MKRYIALLLAIVMLLLTACGTAQPPVDGTTPSTSATTGSTDPSGTEATQDDTTGAAEGTTQQPSSDGTTPPSEGTTGSTEPTTKPTTEPTTKPTTGNSSTDGTEQPTTQPTQPTQPPTQPPQPTEGTKPSEPTPSVGTLTISTPANTVVYVGETLQLQYSYTGNKSDLTFQSMDTDVLTVNNSGLVTGKASGAAQIRVYHGTTQLGSVRIKVENKSGGSETLPAAEKVVLTSKSAPWKCVAGNYMTFTAYAKTSGNCQKVTASSSNTSVATVSHQSTDSSNWCTFKVSCKSGGSTTITITSEDGKKSESYTLTVAGSYSCNPGSGQLTPEQFVNAANGVMRENGVTISTGAGYLELTLSDSQLTWSNARSYGEDWVRTYYPKGITRLGLEYVGTNADGKHVFYIHR